MKISIIRAIFLGCFPAQSNPDYIIQYLKINKLIRNNGEKLFQHTLIPLLMCFYVPAPALLLYQ